MLSVSPTTRVYLRPGPTDLRGGFERLYQMARTCFGQDPLEGDQVFAFCNQRRTRLKLIFHDGTGLWLAIKRPDRGTFAWVAEGPVDPLTAAQLWAMVSGLEVGSLRPAWRRIKKPPAEQKTLAFPD
jgi:transposase